MRGRVICLLPTERECGSRAEGPSSRRVTAWRLRRAAGIGLTSIDAVVEPVSKQRQLRVARGCHRATVAGMVDTAPEGVVLLTSLAFTRGESHRRIDIATLKHRRDRSPAPRWQMKTRRSAGRRSSNFADGCAAASVSIETIPAPVMTAGIVNTPVPAMLPTTRAIAKVRPSRPGGSSAATGTTAGEGLSGRS